MTFAEWIEAKGPKTLQDVLGEELGTIRVWKHRNIIPRKAWPAILIMMPEVGLNDLLAMEKAADK